MSFKALLENNGLSMHQLSVRSGVSYSTIYALANDRAKLEDCAYKSVKNIASVVRVHPDILVNGDSFFHFRDELHNELKQNGPQKFLLNILTNDLIGQHYRSGHWERAMYMLCMADYLCQLMNLPAAAEYRSLRLVKLDPPIVISDHKDEDCLYIPVFKEHGILEGDIFDAV